MAPAIRGSLGRASSLLVAAALGATALASPAAAAPTNPIEIDRHSTSISLLSTTDLHGTAVDWDYVTDQPHDGRGVASIATAIEEVRADRGDAHTLLLDQGDTLSGTPLSHYFQT